MGMIAILSWLLGTALGTRFKVLILFPATIAGAALVAAVGALAGFSLGPAGVSAFIFMIALQLGYLGGLAVRSVAAAARLQSDRHARRPTIVES